MMRVSVTTIWKPCHSVPSRTLTVLLWRFENEENLCCFWQKETGAKRVSLATMLWVSFGFFCLLHFWCKLKNTAFKCFQRLYFIQYLIILVANLWHHHFPNLDNTKTFNISKMKERYSKKENAIILLYFKQSLSNKQQLFFIHRHCNSHKVWTCIAETQS